MRAGRLVMALGLVALMATPVLAQRGGRGGGFGGGNSIGQLVQNKSVQEELKIDADMVKKATDALAKVREDLKDDYAKLGGGRRGGGGGGNNATQEERAEARKKTSAAEDKAVKTVLNDQQYQRLEQIHRQREGVALFENEDVQKALKLSDEQKEKIKTINADLQKDRRELFGAGGGGGGGGRGRGADPEMLQKLQGLQKEAMANAVKVLNEDQKKAYEGLTGKPFDYKPNQGGKPRTDF